MLTREKAELHRLVTDSLHGRRTTGARWRYLVIDGQTDETHAISENGDVYSFARNQTLYKQRGQYVRLSTGDGMKLHSVEKLRRAAFPELFEDTPGAWHVVEIDGEPSAYEISRAGEVRRRSSGRPVKASAGTVWLRHNGRTVTANARRLAAQHFPELAAQAAPTLTE